ncbi:DUF1304 domain-containing protein [Arenicella xantha]|uniref:Putative membrane protein n=1 Tax=Arenicella xantha TaxID=644221 RepID=A0A395JPS5_9GAMM|nr:DUF1304 domain-containing protein [Arenicella xantha]RBP50710.1 putative membrane protein [Arenicella xantha]
MRILATALTLLVALLHVGFMILEMVFWDHPIGHRIFAMSPEQASGSAQLALNQGLYNGFLAAGLLWAIICKKVDVQLFFLICVIVAGVVGAISVKPTIFIIQSVPAILAMLTLIISRR